MAGVVFATMMSSGDGIGQTGINPNGDIWDHCFAGGSVAIKVDDTQAFLIAAIAAIACGYAGDAMNDYKTGVILGTDARAQFVTQFLRIRRCFAAVTQYSSILQAGGEQARPVSRQPSPTYHSPYQRNR